jgi:hypothetical protein
MHYRTAFDAFRTRDFATFEAESRLAAQLNPFLAPCLRGLLSARIGGIVTNMADVYQCSVAITTPRTKTERHFKVRSLEQLARHFGGLGKDHDYGKAAAYLLEALKYAQSDAERADLLRNVERLLGNEMKYQQQKEAEGGAVSLDAKTGARP